MIRGLIVTLVLASPLAAQDADPNNQLVEGYMACLSGGGQDDLTGAMLEGLFWTRSEDGEDGLIYFTPGLGEDTLVYMATDGSFCHVESMVTGSAAASEILAATLSVDEGAAYDVSKDEMGCTRLDLETDVTATITSGGNDPVCASESDSGVRFEFN